MPQLVSRSTSPQSTTLATIAVIGLGTDDLSDSLQTVSVNARRKVQYQSPRTQQHRYRRFLFTAGPVPPQLTSTRYLVPGSSSVTGRSQSPVHGNGITSLSTVATLAMFQSFNAPPGQFSVKSCVLPINYKIYFTVFITTYLSL